MRIPKISPQVTPSFGRVKFVETDTSKEFVRLCKQRPFVADMLCKTLDLLDKESEGDVLTITMTDHPDPDGKNKTFPDLRIIINSKNIGFSVDDEIFARGHLYKSRDGSDPYIINLFDTWVASYGLTEKNLPPEDIDNLFTKYQ